MSPYRSVDRPDIISAAAAPRTRPHAQRPRLNGAAARASAREAAEASRAAARRAEQAAQMLRERRHQVAAARARMLELFERVAPRLARTPGTPSAGWVTRDTSPPAGHDRRPSPG
ncbi:hypothetical protein [Dactylosporangium sp. NPDC000521]|uniref:hypothetical protein n=1 Tax=Dactylosporangium sp. NPDC000521 TaxID=3363975 RepID=UPI0036889795